MSTPFVLRYITEGEHQKQDFKMRIDDARKISKTLVAFANTDGGRLLIGVKDNGSISGVNAEEEAHMIEAAATMYCRPEIKFDLQLWRVENRSVLEVYIHPSPLKPHSASLEPDDWRPFLRKGDQNLPVPGVLIEVWRGTDEDRPQRYFHTPKEKKIFELLQENADMSISQLIRQTRISKQIMTKLLARFIRWQLIELFYVQEQARFKLK